VNISDLDSHTDASVVGKETLPFQDFDREVTASGYDPEVETKSLNMVSSALGYTIPEVGRTVLLSVHQGIFIPQLEHNLLITMQMKLHDIVVNDKLKFQCVELINLSHTVTMRGDIMDDVLTINLYLNGIVYFFQAFKTTQEEFETCDRYELTYEIPKYDPTITSYIKHEVAMAYSRGQLKFSMTHIPDGLSRRSGK
jgi:hypothetical protein